MVSRLDDDLHPLEDDLQTTENDLQTKEDDLDIMRDDQKKYFPSINKVGGRKLLDLLNQGSSNGLDHVMVTSRDIFQPSCGHFQSCNKGQGDTMDEMTILYIIQYLHYF